MVAVQFTTGGRGIFGMTPALAGLARLRSSRIRGRVHLALEDAMSPNGLFDLSGKTAAVIGGGSGIGEAVAIGAATQGAGVVVLDANERGGAAPSPRASPARTPRRSTSAMPRASTRRSTRSPAIADGSTS